MFERLAVSGRAATLVWGYADAAVLGAWVVSRDKAAVWSLRASVEHVDTLRVRQVPLLFTAPRVKPPLGRWVWPVIPNTLQVANGVLTASLGPPEGGR